MDSRATAEILKYLINEKRIQTPPEYTFPIIDAIHVLEKEYDYRWHDLLERPNDLPREKYIRNSYYNRFLVVDTMGDLQIACYDFLMDMVEANELVAWRYIER